MSGAETWEWPRLMRTNEHIERDKEGPVRIEVELHYPDKRRHDRLNLVAFPPLLDSLVRQGRISDDSDDIIHDLVIRRPIVDGTVQTIVRIESVG